LALEEGEVNMAETDQLAERSAVSPADSAPLQGGSPSHRGSAANPENIPAEMMERIIQLRGKIQLSMGQVVLAMMDLPRYQHQTLHDLRHLVVHPLLRNRIAIAHKSRVAEDDGSEAAQEEIVGIAIWASVNDVAEAAITDQVKSGVCPVRLKDNDWTGGENVWLLDVIAGDQKAATTVLTNFRSVAGDRLIKIHPMVSRSVDPAVLEKLKTAAEMAVPK
jgi:cytolysin-activating lysine-acyltransferase